MWGRPSVCRQRLLSSRLIPNLPLMDGELLASLIRDITCSQDVLQQPLY